MNIYETPKMGERIKGNPYVGRGIVIGLTENGKKAATAYFIMGRSENSRNRVFREDGDDVTIFPFDMEKVEDPTLIIYSPVKKYGDKLIVTNGDQTQTIYDFLRNGETFEEALDVRCFEPDKPNYTPRISGLLDMEEDFSYKLSILKSGDPEGTVCNRFTFSYEPLPGLGHFIHTYITDGNPIPSFTGEPERVYIPDSIDDFTTDIWDNLDKDNRISLYTRMIDLDSGETESRLINKNE